ncbi:carbohydrate ABC transporter permease [Halalkalibacterium halodurans]|jgi:multiple sugar transport system permease protein|uniref:ABC transporter permease n=1 Tax=Halalkalibacterium halodurans TaxID=86665 RepID=A0A0M0KLQ6_ALKHA|nr:sugar ABC transporter permease [Halalkalibacterium halodurans]MDY7221650.1 sugar ABC transporter permease [Halalkalibacterium halodurans]MDY7240926.1 sugar ABC transporter permease [Halalkalibacterium halodurans]MED4162309.1 sugar ABC transporter permease [Halalkalibacterium halodurans]TES57942.1 sugar ABC transporter permease [Halalkalibacterium halodurans]TPE70768.1 sugar ABC transporter permease [Halalkalibacterium halodurans]
MRDAAKVNREAIELYDSKTRQERKKWKESFVGYAMISPWLLGFFGLVIGPMIASLYFSFTDYDMLSSANWVGLQNYIHIFTSDPRFVQSLKVTLIFVFVSTPLKLAFALFLAMLFNTGRKGSGLFSTIYYIPSIIGGSVAVAVVWKQLFGSRGAVNSFLELFGFSGVNWIGSTDYALSILILLVVWQFGSPMIIFLAGLRQIPQELYEAASVDGANSFRKFFSITLPMLTPVIFFNLIMQTIGGFMTFTQAYLITGGGPLDSTLFYAVYLYEVAFEYLRMGYASAMAWILLVIIGGITLVFFKSSSYWVHYESEGGRS